MSANFAALLGEQKYTDLVIRCNDGFTFKVHKVVVCTASPVIARMLDQNCMKESTSGEIKHEEFDRSTVALMIEFVYKRSYNVLVNDPQLYIRNAGTDSKTEQEVVLPIDIKDFSNPLRNALVTHARAYGIADYYDISEMKAMAEQAFGALLPYGWIAEKNSDALLDVLVEVCKVTKRGDEGIRRKSIDLTTHALQHLHTDGDATFFLNFVHHEEPAVRAFVFEVLQSAACRLRAYHRDYAALSKRNEKQIAECETERTAKEDSVAQNAKTVAKARIQKEKELAELRAEKNAEIARINAFSRQEIAKVRTEKDAEITKMCNSKDQEIGRKDDAINSLAHEVSNLRAARETDMAGQLAAKDAELQRIRTDYDARAKEDADSIRELRAEVNLAKKDITSLAHFITGLWVPCPAKKCFTLIWFKVDQKGEYEHTIRCGKCNTPLNGKNIRSGFSRGV